MGQPLRLRHRRERVQIVVGGDAIGEMRDARLRGVREDERVMVPLFKTAQVEMLAVRCRLHEAEQIHIERPRPLKIGDEKLDMPGTHDIPHRVLRSRSHIEPGCRITTRHATLLTMTNR